MTVLYLPIVLGTQLTDYVSNSRLCEKCGLIPISRPIMEERFKWLRHVLRIKDDRLPKTVLFGPLATAKRKANPQFRWNQFRWKDVVRKDLREMGNFWEVVKRKTFE